MCCLKFTNFFGVEPKSLKTWKSGEKRAKNQRNFLADAGYSMLDARFFLPFVPLCGH